MSGLIPFAYADKPLDRGSTSEKASSKASRDAGGPTQAKHKRRHGILSYEAVIANTNSSGIEVPTDHGSKFSPASNVHFTWGTISDEIPVFAPKPKRPRRGLGLQYLRQGKSGVFSLQNVADEEKPIHVPNGPDRSYLLRVPLEVRWEIFSYLLIHPEPIIVYSDWAGVPYSHPISHAIIHTCRQISEESACFVYKRNIFHALVRTGLKWDVNCMIAKRFVSFFRNVVIECHKDDWGEDGIKDTAYCVERLVGAQGFLASLTLTIYPKRIGLTLTAAGMETNPATFADFFHSHSPLIPVFSRLRCKTLHVVVKLPQKKRYIISIDIQHLSRRDIGESWLGDMEANRFLMIERRGLAETRLAYLKDYIGDICDNAPKAVSDQKCRELQDEEVLGSLRYSSPLEG